MIQGDISMAEAVLVALSGVVIVFIMLAALWAIIGIISKVMSKLPGKQTASASQASPAAPAAAFAPAAAPSVQLIGIDDKSAACVMAIVSHETGIPLSQLQFRSIRARGAQEGDTK